jgi:tetratricopeptide (TPR) repeat protein
MLRSVVMFVGYNLFFGAIIARTDNAAHIGGLVMGLLLGALIARVAPQHDAIVRRVGVLLVGVVVVGGGGLWLAHAHAYLAHGQSGMYRLKAGDPDAAIREFKNAIKERPNFVPAHEALSDAYIAKGDYDGAAAELRQVIALTPRDERAYRQLGLVYLEQKQPQKAETVFAQLLKINPDSADGHAGMAEAFAYEHRAAEALAEYQRVAEIDSVYPGVYYHIGVLEIRLNQADDAIAALLKQRQAWDDADNEKLLAAVYDTKGMKKEADEARAKAAELNAKK